MNSQQPTDHTPITPGMPPWVERNGFSDWAVAVLWIVLAFVLFQIVAGFVSVALIMIVGGTDPGVDFGDRLLQRMDLLFIGNSAGQILFLGFATYKVAGLHVWKDRVKTFLRFRTFPDTGRITGLTAVLFIVVQPVIWYLGYLNSQLPVPDYFSELQQSQYEMIESFLRSDGALLMAMVNIAFVPAICEEVMFRGYVLSAFEKNWGIWPAIIVSGLMFGLFHLQLTNLLPLASLGFLLALVTWISGSLVPAIVAHFVNNGSAVLLSTYFPDMAVTELTAETAPPVWTLIASILLTAWLIRQLFVSSESESEQR